MTDLLPPEIEGVLSQCGDGQRYTKITLDSRVARDNCIFVAIPGSMNDGRHHIDDVLKFSSTLVIAEKEGLPESVAISDPSRVIWILGVKQYLGVLAARFYGHPSRHMKVFAVTGTNGKTSISHILARALDRLGENASVMGTLGYGKPDSLTPLNNTTPDVISIHHVFSQLLALGTSAVAFEASSHGLHQGRLEGVAIDTAIVTNITRDHLDYHLTMEAYAEAKALLVQWSGLRSAVLNRDDARVAAFRDKISPHTNVVHYSVEPGADVEVGVDEVEFLATGMRFVCRMGDERAEIRSPMMGEFNLGNLLAVCAALWSTGLAPGRIAAALSDLPTVTGRMEVVNVSSDMPVVIVDYAHTPDALQAVLSSLRRHCRGRLWCVFGCGGNRDAGKRPLMGAVAERFADHVVVTTDNPRYESEESIIAAIVAGFGTTSPACITDRASAIQHAIASASADDIVLIAGKGHEQYQEKQGARTWFSDVHVAREALECHAERT